MPLPPFTKSDDLPPGIHWCSLREAGDHFGVGSTRRVAIASRLERVDRLARSTSLVARLIVFGSFVTARLAPTTSTSSC